MSDNVLACALAAAAIFGAFIIAGLIKLAARRQALACLAAQACPHCARNYGPSIAANVNVVKYHWLLAPRHTMASLGLPRTTYLVTCPACRAESEFRENGRLFVHPQGGVLNFTRVGQSRAPAAK